MIGLLAVLTGTLIWLLATTRRRALSLARKMTRELQRSEEQMRRLVEHMLEGLIVVNRRTIVESINPAAARMFGYEPEELVGRHLAVLLPASARADAEAYLRDSRRQAMGRLTEWEGRRKNGDVFVFELLLFAYETGRGLRFAGHVRDLSERRKLERMKQEFVSTVSHELRTPLTSIRGSLGLLANGALGELPEDAQTAAAIAERNVVRLMGLVNDVVDLDRLENRRFALCLSRAEASDIVSQAVDAVRGMAFQRGVKLGEDVAALAVQADDQRLIQVLVNLLSNAVKFSPAGQEVRVSCLAVGPEIEFRVSDQGRGVPAEHQHAIFERFHQVQASDARDKGGSGLGLAIARSIVEQHGGTIGVESEPGHGSTFWFRVPAAAPGATVSPVPAARERKAS
jgi:PAS domain S-box-containing protein